MKLATFALLLVVSTAAPKERHITDSSIVSTDLGSGNKPGMTALMRNAANGNLADVRRGIAAGIDVDASDESGWTALMLASVMCQHGVIDELIKAGAGVNKTDQNGDDALIAAAASRDCDGAAQETSGEAMERTIHSLIRAGANVNYQNLAGETALIWAVKSNNLEAVQALLKADADPGVKDRTGKNATYYAHERAAKISFFSSDVNPLMIRNEIDQAMRKRR